MTGEGLGAGEDFGTVGLGVTAAVGDGFVTTGRFAEGAGVEDGFVATGGFAEGAGVEDRFVAIGRFAEDAGPSVA